VLGRWRRGASAAGPQETIRKALDELGVLHYGASSDDIELMVLAYQRGSRPSRFISPGEGTSIMPHAHATEHAQQTVARLEKHLQEARLLRAVAAERDPSAGAKPRDEVGGAGFEPA
jgi:hypothetical protein